MIEPRSVVHFSIAVSDLEASRKFYTEILGLTLVQASPTTGMVFLRAGHDHVILAKSDVPLQRTAAGRIMHSKSIPKSTRMQRPSSPPRGSRSLRRKTARRVCSSAASSTSAIPTAPL
jgi:catechol 2,3-dioxygenase-like lactoylglutathione lyase family enzyme